MLGLQHREQLARPSARMRLPLRRTQQLGHRRRVCADTCEAFRLPVAETTPPPHLGLAGDPFVARRSTDAVSAQTSAIVKRSLKASPAQSLSRSVIRSVSSQGMALLHKRVAMQF
jgi:hypothetical protein